MSDQSTSCTCTHHHRRGTPRFATVVALLALVIAMSGTSYAAVKINGKNIQKGSVAGSKLKADTVTGAQVDEASLAKVPAAAKADAATKADSATTATSATTAGTAGTAGTVTSLPNDIVKSGAFGTVTTRSADTSIASMGSDFVDVDCLAGEQKLGGGAYFQGITSASLAQNSHLVYSQPDSTGWAARAYNGTGSAKTFTVYVLCLAA
jgi:hypothetical protein